MTTEKQMKIFYKGSYTDFKDERDQEECQDPSSDKNAPNSNSKLAINSLDTSGVLHLSIVPGVLKLSLSRFNTTDTRGYIMKEFEPAFGILPKFMVKTNRIKDRTDMYVLVKVHYDGSSKNNAMILYGTIERYIGNVGDMEVENTLCQIVGTGHWSRKMDKDRDKLLKSISIADLTPDRLDLSSDLDIYTVSVDPDGCKDIDDAISIKTLPDDKIEIGIHIADPTSYLIEGSELDLEVSKRSESLYLTYTTHHMFPESLSTDTFSLLKTKPNRAFSVFLTVSSVETGCTVLTTDIRKTMIRIDSNTSYDKFQESLKDSSIVEDASSTSITKSRNTLYEVGKILYSRYLDGGHIVEYNSKKMIEIFMVLANCKVAEKMVESSSSYDVKLPILIRSQRVRDYNDDVARDKKALKQQTADKVLLDERMKLLMDAAQLRFYSSDTADKNAHASLGLSLYTHFTSPIRRYSDILVHRLLYNLLTKSSTFKVPCLTECNGLHQMFTMNHYKRFYRDVASLQRDILITHHVIDALDENLSERKVQLEGIVLDVTDRFIRVKCSAICDSDEYSTTDSERNVDMKKIYLHFVNSVHTLVLTESNNPELIELFQRIRYKACFLAQDVRKIRTYL
jgi:exoribonuclease R